MKPITSFTKQNLPEVHEAITAELAKIAAKFGLQSIKLGNVSYDAVSFRAQIVAKVDPAISPEAQLKNKSFSETLGYSDNIVGLKFNHLGKEFEILGIDLNRPKFPISAKNTTDGKLVKFSAIRPLRFTTEISYDATKNIFAAV